ncbi:TIM barrel protein [Acidimangrovimonas sediminis]|uniref:TIM barrel protein n=1 Tax=Acidimangrovimonas sediminis TaxID=2056283 RepID=UPI000C7F8D27|nr:TIM barrel protein [Acidimangrovimonas sediminis]
MKKRFKRALNQKTARHLPFAGYLDLAERLGCVGVECRNDLGRPFFDGIAPAEAAKMAEARGQRLLGLSEVYAFNVWDAERDAAIRSLIATAEAAGVETISLIPCVDARRPPPEAQDRAVRDAMARVAPMLEGTGVVALIEVIGFETSSIRHKAWLARTLDEVGAGRFKLIHDTFQHCIAGETGVFAAQTGIVHISGISDPSVALDAEQDGHRILVEADDRCDNVGQMRALLAAGYDGAFSVEATAPEVLDSPTLEADLRRSFDLIDQALSVPGAQGGGN